VLANKESASTRSAISVPQECGLIRTEFSVGTGDGYESFAIILEAYYGNAAKTQQRAAVLLALSKDANARCGAVEVLAMAGNAVRAQVLVDDLAKRFPEDTVMRFSCLPQLKARIALSSNDPVKAIELLQVSAPYELGGMSVLGPTNIRGEAYLAAHPRHRSRSRVPENP
jgi:hypothetical protein